MYKNFISSDGKQQYIFYDDGKIYNVNKQRWVDGHITNKGYIQVYLHLEHKSRMYLKHRVVMFIFSNRTYDYPYQVNHIDGNKENNSFYNLEWNTQSENIKHAFKNNLNSQKGENNSCAVLTEKEVHEICQLIQDNKLTYDDIAKLYNICHQTVSCIAHGKLWSEISRMYTFKHRRMSSDDVYKLCLDMSTGNYTYTDLAKKYNTTTIAIKAIRTKKRWKEISEKFDFPMMSFK